MWNFQEREEYFYLQEVERLGGEISFRYIWVYLLGRLLGEFIFPLLFFDTGGPFGPFVVFSPGLGGALPGEWDKRALIRRCFWRGYFLPKDKGFFERVLRRV